MAFMQTPAALQGPPPAVVRLALGMHGMARPEGRMEESERLFRGAPMADLRIISKEGTAFNCLTYSLIAFCGTFKDMVQSANPERVDGMQPLPLPASGERELDVFLALVHNEPIGRSRPWFSTLYDAYMLAQHWKSPRIVDALRPHLIAYPKSDESKELWNAAVEYHDTALLKHCVNVALRDRFVQEAMHDMEKIRALTNSNEAALVIYAAKANTVVPRNTAWTDQQIMAMQNVLAAVTELIRSPMHQGAACPAAYSFMFTLTRDLGGMKEDAGQWQRSLAQCLNDLAFQITEGTSSPGPNGFAFADCPLHCGITRLQPATLQALAILGSGLTGETLSFDC